jgi:hypothetical protein
VSQLATRVLEIRPDGLRDYPGTYDEYVHACGDDHLDVDRVVLKARTENRKKPVPRASGNPDPKRSAARVKKQLEHVTERIRAAEVRVQEIDALFCRPDYFTGTPGDEVRARQAERATLQGTLADLMSEWERLEVELASPEGSA